MRQRVLIADDHALILNAVENVLKPSYEIVDAVRSGREAVSSARELRPDVVVLDVSMPEMNGFEAAKEILQHQPEVKLIFLSMHTGPVFLRKALEVGGHAYVLKSGLIEELTDAVERVLDGGFYTSPGLGPSPDNLTQRQTQVLRLLAQGLLNKEIAYKLGISMKTVEFHRARVMAALNARSMAELMRIAVERELIPPPDTQDTD